MTAADDAEWVKNEMGSAWLPTIYRERILKMRTRAYHFERRSKTGSVAIQHTLLGVELKVGNKRLLSPDLPTARYLAVFARAGCDDVAVPYDITKVSQLADELESSWYRMLLLADHRGSNKAQAFKARIRGLLIAKLRTEIAEAGPGTPVPEFKQSTRQRR